MSTLELLLIALALSMDAFAVSLAAGAHEKVRGFRAAFRLWFHFGLFQSLMTVTGWFVGSSLERWVAAWDHWAAFALLSLVGLKMLKEARRRRDGAADADRGDPSRGLVMLSLSVATSVDALAVGVTLGVLRVPIWSPGIVIGAVTGLLSLIGLRIGRLLGERFGRVVEMAGGLLLIAMAFKIALLDP